MDTVSLQKVPQPLNILAVAACRKSAIGVGTVWAPASQSCQTYKDYEDMAWDSVSTDIDSLSDPLFVIDIFWIQKLGTFRNGI